MQLSAKTVYLATTWGNRLALTWVALYVMNALFHAHIPVLVLAPVSIAAAVCFLITGLGGPKRLWWTILWGAGWALNGLADIYFVLR